MVGPSEGLNPFPHRVLALFLRQVCAGCGPQPGISADPATAGIRRVRPSPCFSGYLLKYLLLCHLHLFRGESEGGWDSPIYVRPPPIEVTPGLLGEPRHRHRLLMGHSGALWLATERHSERVSRKWSLLEPPAKLRKGSRCSESSIFISSKDLTLEPILDQFWSPKGVQVLYDARPGGTHGSIWALVGAQALRLSATSGGSCAKSGYSWPQTCPKSNQNQILAAFDGLTWAYSA